MHMVVPFEMYAVKLKKKFLRRNSDVSMRLVVSVQAKQLTMLFSINTGAQLLDDAVAR